MLPNLRAFASPMTALIVTVFILACLAPLWCSWLEHRRTKRRWRQQKEIHRETRANVDRMREERRRGWVGETRPHDL